MKMPASDERALAAALEAGSEDERLWFERHIGRNHRIRPPSAGDLMLLPPLPKRHRWIMIVRQIRPGVRLRASLEWRGPMPVNSETTAISVLAEAASCAPTLAEIEQVLQEEGT
jgi:hypothetical protein